MNTAILTYQNARLTPEARWLLMQWTSVIGLDSSTDWPLQTLFASLGLTYAQGRRAWDVLICRQGKNQERFIDIERLPSKGPGRPPSRYRLSTKLVNALKVGPSTACEHHSEEITTLAKTTRMLAPDKTWNLPESSRLRGTGLMLPNRWLLMVLLAHADALGIVTRLSISAMHSLTGMSRYRITSQLKKLGNLGLIAHHQPGRYSPQARRRKTSIYFLELAHTLMGNCVRKSVTLVSPPSSTEHKKTELVDGIVDAVMAAGVCSLQIDALLKNPGAIKASGSIASDDTRAEAIPKHDTDCEAKNHQEKYDKIKEVLNHGLALLPITRHLKDGIEELLKQYDKDDADWLLTSIHIDTSRLLSSAWGELRKGQLGPEQPDHGIIVGIAHRLGLIPEYTVEESPTNEANTGSKGGHYCSYDEDDKKPDRPSEVAPTAKQISYPPLAILFYALSHHLAKRLQGTFELHGDIDFEAMTFMLAPCYSKKPDEYNLPAYQLCGYVLNAKKIEDNEKSILFRSPVNEDLKTYWRTHHQDCLSIISDEQVDS